MSPFYPYPLLNACCRTILTIVSCCLLLNCMNYIVPTTAQNIPSESDGSTSQDSFRSILLAPDGKAPSPPPETMMMTAQQQQELQSEQTMSTPVSIIDESDGKVCDFHGIEITKECPSDYSGFDWEAYASELYQARAMIFSGNIDGAREYTLRLLQHITGKFSFAFECPMAAIATYYTMATILMFQGAQRRALSMLQMGFIFVRDRGFHECSPWPVQGWDMMMAGKNLLEQVQTLDRPNILLDTHKSLRYAHQRIAIVSICSYAPEEIVRQISIQNHEIYARLHGYDFYLYLSPDEIEPNLSANMSVKDGVHKPFFWKVNAVMNAFQGKGRLWTGDGSGKGKSPYDQDGTEDHPKPDWVLWADCDALIMDPERTIDSVIHMYTGNATTPLEMPGTKKVHGMGLYRENVAAVTQNFNVMNDHLNNPNSGTLVAPLPNSPENEAAMRGGLDPPVQVPKKKLPYADVSLILAVDSTGINNGVWMMRNSDWARQFLTDWWHSNILDGAGKNHNCSDQSTMQHALLYSNSMQADAAWDSVEGPIWPLEVRVAYQEHMQSFHQATAMTVLSREWQDGDFIRHHPGCHYYKEPCKWLYQQGQEIFMEKLQWLISKEQTHNLGPTGVVEDL